MFRNIAIEPVMPGGAAGNAQSGLCERAV